MAEDVRFRYEAGPGHLWSIRRISGFAACYLVRVQEPVLIDAGTAGDVPRILRALEGAGIRPGGLKQIVLTHHHLDHVGGAAALREATGARVLAHPADAPYISGRLPRPPVAGVAALLGRWLARGAKPVTVDDRLLAGESVGGLEVLHTPGHTPGSICLYLPPRRALFVGDLLRTTGRRGDRLAEMWGFATADRALARRSIQRVAALPVDAVYPSHGEVLDTRAGEALRALARRLGG